MSNDFQLLSYKKELVQLLHCNLLIPVEFASCLLEGWAAGGTDYSHWGSSILGCRGFFSKTSMEDFADLTSTAYHQILPFVV